MSFAVFLISFEKKNSIYIINICNAKQPRMINHSCNDDNHYTFTIQMVFSQCYTSKASILLFALKRAVGVISCVSPCKADNARFTTVPLKLLFNQYCGSIDFLGFKRVRF